MAEELSMDATLEALSAEIDRLFESAEYTMVQHFIASTWWSRAHYTLGLLGTIAAAVSAAIAARAGAGLSPSFTAIIAGSAGVLTAVITFLRPKDQADLHHEKGVAYENLRIAARMLKEIGLRTETSAQANFTKLEVLIAEKIKLNGRKPAAPGTIIYFLAKRQIERGQTSYRVDQAPTEVGPN